jgi:trehalose 6-phosphate synthase
MNPDHPRTPDAGLAVVAPWLPGGDAHRAVDPPLVAALAERGGLWIGESEPDNHASPGRWAVDVRSVDLSPGELADYRHGHCARTLRPLYHDGAGRGEFRRAWRAAYRAVNQRFAHTAAQLTAPDATVWVHDHHLQLVPDQLRRLRPDVRIGFFLHGAFPPPERFLQQPMRRELLAGLLGADLIGFQHARSARNFLDIVGDLAGLRRGARTVQVGARRVAVGVFPTSVDVAQIGALATEADVRARATALRAGVGEPRLMLLSVGVPETAEGVERRLDAFGQLLADGALSPDEVVLVHVGTDHDPAAGGDPGCRERIERLVAQINGVWSKVGRPVLHYLSHLPDRAETVAMYLAADVLLATPLHHGMPLAAKEFVAARTDATGHLVLSEFTAAATDLPYATIVNPYDIDAVKQAIIRAAAGSRRPNQAMQAMRRRILEHDAYRWADTFLDALAEATSHRPALEAVQEAVA